ncbi:MAG: hypothetical protein NTV02_01015 [Candidatus Zambryskibacteria bacterium]|nr:hypothetical protein [Candidatus Zambryskibacteria bacterium]
MIDIIHYQVLPEGEFLARLKETRLKGFGQPLVYKNSALVIKEQVNPDVLVPAQLYVLKGQVKIVLDLADAFEHRGVNVFALTGALLFWLGGSDPDKDPPIPFLPPVIEESREPDGRVVQLINDGMHRIAAARRLGRNINIVHISNVPQEYPYYAYALEGGFSQVTEIDEITEGFKKKNYRDPENYKALFRVFTGVFPGVQADRPPIRAKV